MNNIKNILFLLILLHLNSCLTVANFLKNSSILSSSGIKESLITKTKDILDPSRGGGIGN